MKISIIIPALNEEKYISTLLESIKNQNYKDYEIIVADSNSTDKTCEIAKSYGAKIVEGGMPAKGRNNGARAATGEFLFFFDADIQLPENFLQNAVNEIEERFLDLATCDFIPMSDLRFDKIVYKLTNLFVKVNQFSRNAQAFGACIIISRRLFHRIGGFDENIRVGEDVDLYQRSSGIRPLRVLRSTFINLSIRRLEKEGRLLMIYKSVLGQVNSLSRGLLQSNYDYEFAKYENIKTKKFDEGLKKLEGSLDKLEEKYKEILNTEIKFDPFERDDSGEEKGLEAVKTDLQKEWDEFLQLFKKKDKD